MLCLTVAFAAPAKAQTGTLRFDQRRLRTYEIIAVVEAQTDYRFAYTHTVFNTTRTVTLPGLAITVKDALECMTADSDARYAIRGNLIVIVPAKPEPNVNVPQEVMIRLTHRTGDIYRSISPDDIDPSPVPRPERPAAEGEEEQVSETEPEPEQAPEPYSDYTPVAQYAGLQVALPRWAIKTNAFYTAITQTPNLAFEFAVDEKKTIEVTAGYHPWNHKRKYEHDTKKFDHLLVIPEFRWWSCERFNRHYFGAHAIFARYEISQYNVPTLFDYHYRYDGYALGAGATYGYHLALGKRWGIDFNVGLGVVYLNYDRYSCDQCDTKPARGNKWYFGPTRAGVTLTLLFK